MEREEARARREDGRGGDGEQADRQGQRARETGAESQEEKDRETGVESQKETDRETWKQAG